MDISSNKTDGRAYVVFDSSRKLYIGGRSSTAIIYETTPHPLHAYMFLNYKAAEQEMTRIMDNDTSERGMSSSDHWISSLPEVPQLEVRVLEKPKVSFAK